MDSFDYDIAKAWYLEHGTNTTLKALLKRGYSAFTDKLLRKEVPKELIEVMPKIEAITKEIKQTQKEVPPAVETLERKWRKAYSEAAYWHSRLKHLPPKERAEKCFLILNFFSETIHPIWDRLEYYKANGSFPKVVEKITVNLSDKAELTKELLRLRVKISRAKKKGDSEKLSLLEAERDAIERKLSEL